MSNSSVYVSPSDKEELHGLFPGVKIGLRELKFIIGYLAINCEIERMTESAIQSEVLLNVKMHARAEQIEYINRSLREARFDVDELSFIENSKSHNFLVEKIIEKFRENSNFIFYGNMRSRKVNYVLGHKDFLIFLIDAQIGSLDVKRSLVEIAKLIFHKYAQRVNFIKWYKEEKDRIQIAFEYFKMKGICFSLESNMLDIHDLMIFFWSNEKTQEQNKLVDINFRRYYYNKKSREGRTTKQANFSLSEQSIKNIEKIAEKYRMNKSMVVDAIFKSPSLVKQIDLALKN